MTACRICLTAIHHTAGMKCTQRWKRRTLHRTPKRLLHKAAFSLLAAQGMSCCVNTSQEEHHPALWCELLRAAKPASKLHSNGTTREVLTNLSSCPDWAGLQRQPVAKRHRMAHAVKLIKRGRCIWHPCHLHIIIYQHNCSMAV